MNCLPEKDHNSIIKLTFQCRRLTLRALQFSIHPQKLDPVTTMSMKLEIGGGDYYFSCLFLRPALSICSGSLDDLQI